MMHQFHIIGRKLRIVLPPKILKLYHKTKLTSTKKNLELKLKNMYYVIEVLTIINRYVVMHKD